MNALKKIHFSLLGIAFLGASIFGVGWAAIWITRDSYTIAFIALGASLCCFDIGFQTAYSISATARPRTTFGSAGTIIRPQKFVDLIFYVGTVGGFSAAASYLLLAALGMDSDISSWIIQRTARLISIFALIFCGWCLYGMLMYVSESRLRLSTRGIEVWNGHWCVSVHKKWDEVEQISDQLPRNKRIRRELIVFGFSKGRNAMLVCDTMTADSDALREWARFYWRHPEFRNELTDGRALQRLDDQKFTV